MVNILSMFCPELQKMLKQIYDLTRKGRQFLWGKEHQDFFEEIKCRLIKPPAYICPTQLEDFIYIQIQVYLQQEVHYNKYKMESPS